MRYVGIDPSSKTGLVILDSGGEIINSEEITTDYDSELERFVDIAMQMVEQIESNDFIAIEGFSYGSKGKGVSFQYGLGWIIRYFLYERGYAYVEIPPTSVKKYATGKGNVKKDAMVLPIYKKWGFDHPSDNVRDAFVLAKIASGLNNTNHGLGLTDYQKEVLKTVSK